MWSHQEIKLMTMDNVEQYYLVSSVNESAGTSSFSKNVYRDRSHNKLDDVVMNSPVECIPSPSRKELGIYYIIIAN